MILCGGKGTRAYPHTVDVPKPLLYVGGRPVLSHVMEIYARQGFCDFVLAAGYKRDLVSAFARRLPASWRVEVVDTGEDTDKADRIARCRDRLGDTFFVSYSDGLGDVDLEALLAAHRSHGRSATITAVPMPSQYGTVELDGGGRVARNALFREARPPILPRVGARLGMVPVEVFELELADVAVGVLQGGPDARRRRTSIRRGQQRRGQGVRKAVRHHSAEPAVALEKYASPPGPVPRQDGAHGVPNQRREMCRVTINLDDERRTASDAEPHTHRQINLRLSAIVEPVW